MRIDGIDGGETLPIFGVELEIEARRDRLVPAIAPPESDRASIEAALGRILAHYFEAIGERRSMPADQLADT